MDNSLSQMITQQKILDSHTKLKQNETHLFLEVEVVTQNLRHAAKGLLVMVRVEVLHLNRNTFKTQNNRNDVSESSASR